MNRSRSIPIVTELNILCMRFPVSRTHGREHLNSLDQMGVVGNAEPELEAKRAYIASQLRKVGYYYTDERVRDCLLNDDVIETVCECLERIRMSGNCKVDHVARRISGFSITHDPCTALLRYICGHNA
ncbi:MAG: hypothetical protein AB2799_21135 [Candidatus Thiodiazotropha sp.]